MTSLLHSMDTRGATILDMMKDKYKEYKDSKSMNVAPVVPNSPKQTAASTTAPTVPTVIATPAPDSTDELTEQISNLQKLESNKYIALDILLKSNPSPDNIAQQKIIINDISEFSTLR